MLHVVSGAVRSGSFANAGVIASVAANGVDRKFFCYRSLLGLAAGSFANTGDIASVAANGLDRMRGISDP